MNDVVKDILIAVVSGGVAATLIKLIGDKLMWKRNRQAEKEDRAEKKKDDAEKQAALNIEKRLENLEAKQDDQSDALKFILYYTILTMALAYIADGEIDFDERRILNDMHRSYHSGLHGNGDLDNLMSEVNKLPLKTNK